MMIWWDTGGAGGSVSTNPGAENVLFGRAYIINGVPFVGELEPVDITMVEATLIGQSTEAVLEAEC